MLQSCGTRRKPRQRQRPRSEKLVFASYAWIRNKRITVQTPEVELVELSNSRERDVALAFCEELSVEQHVEIVLNRGALHAVYRDAHSWK